MDPPAEGRLSYDSSSRSSRAPQATAKAAVNSFRQGQGRTHLGSCTRKIVLARFLFACVILLVGYQYIQSSKALSSIMSNSNKKAAAAAVERVGSKNGDAPTAPDDKFLTIVTGASSNHMDVLFKNILATIQWRIVDRLHESYFDHLRVIVYDLDLDESTRSKNKERISNIPFAEYRGFDYDRYPAHFNIEQDRGAYAWKPAIIEEVVREEQASNNEREVNLVYWIDSGFVVSKECTDFDTDLEHCLRHGIYAPRLGRVKNSCHKETADYLNISEELWLNGSGVAAGIFLTDVKNKTVYDRIVKPWFHCALVKECIAPPGATLNNHKYDQGVLCALLAKNSIQLTEKEGESIKFGKKSTSCIMRGRENGSDFTIPNPERLLFTKQPEKIVREDDSGMMKEEDEYYCESQEWHRGSAISCYERVLHIKQAYKLSDHNAKVSTLDDGCLCPKRYKSRSSSQEKLKWALLG